MPLALAALLALQVSAGPKPVAPGAPGAPAHLDLASSWTLPMPSGKAPAPAALGATEAAAILAAPALGEEAPGQLAWVDEKAARAKEKTLLAAERGAVTRNGGRLVVTPKSARPILFADTKRAATRDAEGDAISHAYLGRLGTGRLHRVETSFQHDAPGSYLVNPDDGRTAFVHEGSDHVVVAPGDARLAIFNDLNGPLTLVVLAIDASGPAVEIACRASAEKMRVELKGWRAPDVLDFVAAGVPLRLTKGAAGWSLLSPDRNAPGIACASPVSSRP